MQLLITLAALSLMVSSPAPPSRILALRSGTSIVTEYVQARTSLRPMRTMHLALGARSILDMQCVADPHGLIVLAARGAATYLLFFPISRGGAVRRDPVGSVRLDAGVLTFAVHPSLGVVSASNLRRLTTYRIDAHGKIAPISRFPLSPNPDNQYFDFIPSADGRQLYAYRLWSVKTIAWRGTGEITVLALRRDGAPGRVFPGSITVPDGAIGVTVSQGTYRLCVGRGIVSGTGAIDLYHGVTGRQTAEPLSVRFPLRLPNDSERFAEISPDGGTILLYTDNGDIYTALVDGTPPHFTLLGNAGVGPWTWVDWPAGVLYAEHPIRTPRPAGPGGSTILHAFTIPKSGQPGRHIAGITLPGSEYRFAVEK